MTSSPGSSTAANALYRTCFPPVETMSSSWAYSRPFSRWNFALIAARSSVVPSVAVYFVRPRSTASRAASSTCAGGWKSGSPAVMAMTSVPPSRSSRARALNARVDDSFSCSIFLEILGMFCSFRLSVRRRPGTCSCRTGPGLAGSEDPSEKFVRREEKPDFPLGGFRSVGTVGNVLVEGRGKITADGAGCRILRVGGSHHLAPFADGVFPFEHHGDSRSAGDEGNEPLEKRFAAEQHYGEHRDKPFFEGLGAFITTATGGPPERQE